jgi:glucose/arabinose dehydrogenase
MRLPAFAATSPGTVTVADLPAPAPDQSVDNGPTVVARPANAWPIAPKGFKVELYATDLDNPRLLRVAPNGDLFLAESETGKIKVFRGVGRRRQGQTGPRCFAERSAPALRHRVLSQRARTRNGSTSATPTPSCASPTRTATCGQCQARAAGRTARRRTPARRRPLDPRPGLLKGRQQAVRLGRLALQRRRPDTHPGGVSPRRCARVHARGQVCRGLRLGIRNCVGEAINPTTGELWCSTNERDVLGNNLVPDYVTHVQEGGFYGWPWYYMGGWAAVIRIRAMRASIPSCKGKVITPDILVNPHFASLEMTFYEGSQFPAEYKGDGFAVRARLVEPRPARRLRGHPAAHAERPRDRRVRRFPHRLHGTRRRRRLGPAGGRAVKLPTALSSSPTTGRGRSGT